MYNRAVLVGNLTRDIEMKFSQGGMAIAKTAIATSRKFKSNTGEQKEEVCFVDITFFGRSAEIANQYLRKGSKILVEGRLVFDQWTDQNGQKRSKHGVTVDVMQMLDSRGTTNTENPVDKHTNIEQDIRVQQPQTYGKQPPGPEHMPSIDIDEGDIPF
jgi:single-strand DNA-binding protein